MKLYLASQSPRRRELLDQIGIEYECLDVDIDEYWDGQESAHDYVARLALEKARSGYRMLNQNVSYSVIAADTAVVLDDEILGKADNQAEALNMLLKLSGRCHHVYTGIALVGQVEQVRVNLNRVFFRPLTQEECDQYCGSGEPIGKAGGYAIQGKAAQFIERLEGSYSGVMGLSLYDTALLLKNIR